MPDVRGGTYFYLRALQNGCTPCLSSPGIIDEIENEFFEEDEPQSSKMHEALTLKDPKAAEKIHPNDRYRLVRALAVLKASSQLPSQLEAATSSERQRLRIWLKYAVVVPRMCLTKESQAHGTYDPKWAD